MAIQPKAPFNVRSVKAGRKLAADYRKQFPTKKCKQCQGFGIVTVGVGVINESRCSLCHGTGRVPA
jgi:DnaJ-class molecular chaperone